MPVPQSYVSPEERLARDERASADRRMSQPCALTADPNLLLECADRPVGLPRAGDRGEDWGGDRL